MLSTLSTFNREGEADAEHYPPLREIYVGPGGHVASEQFCAAVESNYSCHTNSKQIQSPPTQILHYSAVLGTVQVHSFGCLGPCI